MTMTDPDADAPGAITIHLEGEIDVSNASTIGDELVDLIDSGKEAIVVMCSAITFVESRGLAMMARVQRFAEENGCQLSWRGFPLQVLRAMHVTGLDRYLRIEV
jgi:anti-sigma B factor antagonist